MLPEALQTFEGFQPKPLNSPGRYKIDRTPSHEPGTRDQNHEYAADYHVESDYNPAQYELIGVTMGCFNLLVNGAAPQFSPREMLPFSSRIVENFIAQDGDPSFTQALYESSLNLCSDFKVCCPNLMPAFKIIMENGGATGFVRTLTPMRMALDFALDGSLTEDNKRTFWSMHHSFFVAEFPITMLGSYPFREEFLTSESLCPAEGFVQSIVLEAKKAALELAKNSMALAKYTPETDSDIDKIRSLKDSLKEHVKNLFEDTLATHSREDI